MNLYLDDDTVDKLLIRLLRRAGHDVLTPSEVGLSGKHDPVHLAHAIERDRVFMTMNYEDFEELHDLIMTAEGHHPGILIVRKDNDRRRDLTPSGIVQALANLKATGVELCDGVYVLNHWR